MKTMKSLYLLFWGSAKKLSSNAQLQKKDILPATKISSHIWGFAKRLDQKAQLQKIGLTHRIDISSLVWGFAKKLRFKTQPQTSWINSIALLVLTFASLLYSCKKSLEVPLPKTQLSAEAALSSDATANAILSNVYIKSAGVIAGGTGSVTSLGAFLADETDSYAVNVYLSQLATNSLTPNNTYSTNLWINAYATIYQCNILLEGLKDNPSISPAVARQLRGEAYFFRALSHLYLSTFFGSAPIVTTTDYRINATIAQSPREAVYASVISDLLEAKELLAQDYSSFASERIRPTTWAASALLARAYLYAGNNQLAKTEASRVIANTSLFTLSTFAGAFLKNATEQVLQYRPTSTTLNTNEGNNFVLTAKPVQLAMSAAFYNGFESGDLRKTNWTSKVTVSGVDYYFPYKYKVKTGATLSEYSSMLRLSELYLIRAEAQARLNELPGAIADIDVIRSRASLPKIAITNPSISQSALLDAILKERRSELFSEWAHRWIDLQRFGKAVTTLSAIKANFNANAQLLPIPEYELKVNPMLKQNPGYQ